MIHSDRKIAGGARTEDTIKQLTDLLAERVMGWKAGPDRFLKSGRSWIPKWRFRPLTNILDAFQLLEHTEARYTLTSDSATHFTVQVEIGEGKGTAAGESKPRVITLAVARALGLEVDP